MLLLVLIFIWGSMMSCEFRFLGVFIFLWLDKLEFLFSVVDKILVLVLLEIRLEGEEIFEMDFLNELLLLVLFIDEEVIFFEEIEEGEDFNEVFRLNFCLLVLELVDVVSVLEMGEGEEGNDFCVFGMFVLFAGLVLSEGIEFFRIFGSDFFSGFEVKEFVFLFMVELILLFGRFVSEMVCFLGKFLVLIFLVIGVDFELCKVLFMVGLVKVDLVLFLVFIFFFVIMLMVEVFFGVVVEFSFEFFEIFFLFSVEGFFDNFWLCSLFMEFLVEEWLCIVFWCIFIEFLVDCINGIFILV